MDNVIEFKSRQARVFDGNIVDTEVIAIYELVDSDDFFDFINGVAIDWSETDPIITRMHESDGWALGLESIVLNSLGSTSVMLQCTKAGKVKMYATLDEANSVFWEHGLGNAKLYNCPINSRTFDA